MQGYFAVMLNPDGYSGMPPSSGTSALPHLKTGWKTGLCQGATSL